MWLVSLRGAKLLWQQKMDLYNISFNAVSDWCIMCFVIYLILSFLSRGGRLLSFYLSTAVNQLMVLHMVTVLFSDYCFFYDTNSLKQ